jgi:hypothetical protein
LLWRCWWRRRNWRRTVYIQASRRERTGLGDQHIPVRQGTILAGHAEVQQTRRVSSWQAVSSCRETFPRRWQMLSQKSKTAD